jgi:hypothetical protein
VRARRREFQDEGGFSWGLGDLNGLADFDRFRHSRQKLTDLDFLMDIKDSDRNNHDTGYYEEKIGDFV